MTRGELILIGIGTFAILGAIITLIVYGRYMKKHSVSQKTKIDGIKSR